MSRQATAHPPEAEPGQHDGEADEDRRLVPLECPIAAAGLVHEHFSEMTDAGGRAPALEARSLVEEVATHGMTGLIDEPVREDPVANVSTSQTDRPAVRLIRVRLLSSDG